MNTRDTIQKNLVLEAVKELQCHASAEDIYSHIVRKYPTISKGTVYRNLGLLCEAGVVRRVKVSGLAGRYDHQCHNHYHVQCVKCGRVHDVDMEYIKALENRINDTHGFLILDHDIVFRGICPECNI